MRKPWTLLTALLVTGCVAPPLVTVAMFAADGMSLATTGKSMTDHALSLVVQRDCAVWRVVAERNVAALCRLDGVLALDAAGGGGDRSQGDDSWIATPVRALASVGSAPASAAATVAASAESPPVRRLAPPGPPPVKAAVRVTAPAEGPPVRRLLPRGSALVLAAARVAAPPATASYLVVGSFRHRANAETLRERFTADGAAIALAMVEGRVRFRVVIGPIAGAARVATRDRLALAGIPDAWPLALCPASLTAPPCADAPARVTLLEGPMRL